MKQDVQRIAELVTEYWNRGGPGKGSSWYHKAIQSLKSEIGEERFETANEQHDMEDDWARESHEGRRESARYR